MNDMTRKEAQDFLADLLFDESDIKQQTLFDVPRDCAPKPQPAWKVQGITLVYVTHTCENCGSQHTHTSPKLLLNEALIDADGTVMKTHQTACPKSADFSSLGFAHSAKEKVCVDKMDCKIETLEGESTDFCSECIHELSVHDLQRMFVKQQERRVKKASGDRLERIAAAQASVKGKKVTPEMEANMLDSLLTANADESSDEE